jgi:hypothetical protein
MAFDSQNQVLVDVLENGPDSPYHEFFNINWNHLYEGMAITRWVRRSGMKPGCCRHRVRACAGAMC